jgi:hypothetical protein
MKRTVPVFLLLVIFLFGSTSYAGVISGGSAGTEVWVAQTATTDNEWSEPYIWNVTATSPVTVYFTATPTASGAWASWEVENWGLTGPGAPWMGNLLLAPWEDYHTETWTEEVNPGNLSLWGGAGYATLNITVTWGWPE